MKDFNMKNVEVISLDSEHCTIRTSDLIPTLFFMQEQGRRIEKLTPDDRNGKEYNILDYYKPRGK